MKPPKNDYLHLVGQHISSYFTGKARQVEIDGKVCRYLDAGDGEAVVFLHGLFCNKSFWRSQLQNYGPGYRCIALDMPGNNNEPNSSTTQSLSELARWLDKVLDALELKQVHLVAHSALTWLGTLYASTRRERVMSLTLLNMPDFMNVDSEKATNVIRLLEESIELEDTVGMEKAFQSLFYRPPSIPRVLFRYHLNQQLRNRPSLSSMIKGFERSVPMVLAHTRHLNCPTLIVNGDHDTAASELFVDSLRWHFPMAQIITLQNCGHLCMVEKPREVAALHLGLLQNQQHCTTHASRVNEPA